ncbi:MAG TPA: hypothetical protein VJ750_04555 [Rhizomicrobium sp.]|nr:hypothetical protein [Rhizomicrobium sp.]
MPLKNCASAHSATTARHRYWFPALSVSLAFLGRGSKSLSPCGIMRAEKNFPNETDFASVAFNRQIRMVRYKYKIKKDQRWEVRSAVERGSNAEARYWLGACEIARKHAAPTY